METVVTVAIVAKLPNIILTYLGAGESRPFVMSQTFIFCYVAKCFIFRTC